MRIFFISAAILGLLSLASPAQAWLVRVTVINNSDLSIALELTPGANTTGGGVGNLDAGGSIVLKLEAPSTGTASSVLKFGSGNGEQTTVTITSTSAEDFGFMGISDMSYSVSMDGPSSCTPTVSTEVKDITQTGQEAVTYGAATVHITKCGGMD